MKKLATTILLHLAMASTFLTYAESPGETTASPDSPAVQTAAADVETAGALVWLFDL